MFILVLWQVAENELSLGTRNGTRFMITVLQNGGQQPTGWILKPDLIIIWVCLVDLTIKKQNALPCA